MEENNKFETNVDESGFTSVYGSSMNPNQMNINPMSFGPIQDPPPIQGAPVVKPKKSRTGLAVGILCAAAVVIVVAIGVLLSKALLGKDAKSQLAKGMANMTKEMAAYRSSVAEDIGLSELYKLKYTKPMHTNMDLSFTDPSSSGSFNNIDVVIDAVTDHQKKMAEYDVSLGTYGIDMNIGNVVAADNTLYVSLPIVFQDEVYSLDLTNLGRDFNKSAWSDLMNETLPEDYSLTLFGDTKSADIIRKAGEESELQRLFGRRSKKAANSMTIESIKNKREFTFGGTSAEYGGVQVTIDKDAYNEMMEGMRQDFFASDVYNDFMQGYQTTYRYDFEEFKESFDSTVNQLFGVRYEQDGVINFYMDNKGRIVNISTPEDIAISSQYADVDFFAVDIDFSGRERTLDVIEGGIYVQTDDEILYLGISRNASITDEFYSEDVTLSLQDNNSDEEITLQYQNMWGYDDQTFDLQLVLDMPDSSLGLNADGAYTGIVKGEGYTFRINHAAISADDEDMLLMAGSIMTEPADNKIEVPQNATNILEMSTSEITGLLYGTLY